jgi:uncharacterized protein YjdB
VSLSLLVIYSYLSAANIYAADVTDIEITDFKDTVKIGETLDMKATVVPKDATEQIIKFTSSNTNVATINSDGKITGIAAGTTTITAEAGNRRKSMTLTVKVGTQNLSVNVNENYLILSSGNTFQLSVKVIPEEADKALTYSSTASSIVTVSPGGLITALRPGHGSIIVSNWDNSKIINVIVNDSGKASETDVSLENNSENQESDGSDASEQAKAILAQEENLNKLLTKIAAAPNNGEITVQGQEYAIVTSAILKELYGTDKYLTIHYPEYTITLYGRDIKNISNELSTKISLTPGKHDGKEGLKILVNKGDKLPGKLYIKLFGQEIYSHLYLLDEKKNAYNKINTLNGNNEFSIDDNGKYLLTQRKLSDPLMNWIAISAIVIIAVGAIAAYIAMKKRHWFW